MFCIYKAGNPDCLIWTGESHRAFLDPCYSRTAVLVREKFQFGVSSGFWGIPLASEILLLEYSAQAGQKEAGKEGNGLLCSSCSPAPSWLWGLYPRMLPLLSLLIQQAQLGANIRSKLSGLCWSRSSLAGALLQGAGSLCWGQGGLTSHDWMQ